MKHQRRKLFCLLALVLAVLTLTALTSCFSQHTHVWSEWELHEDSYSRHCESCGRIETSATSPTPVTPPPAQTTAPTTPPASTTAPVVTTPAPTTPVVTTPAQTTPVVTTPVQTTPAPVTPPSTTVPPSTTPPSTTVPPSTTPPSTTVPPSTTPPSTTVPPSTTPPSTTPPTTTPPTTTVKPPETTDPVVPEEPHRHEFGEYISDENATCTEDGTKTAKCLGCSATDTVTDVDSRLGHRFGEYISDKNATCTEDGTKTAVCARCFAPDTVTDKGSRIDHSYTSTLSEGSCTEQGTILYDCIWCEDSYVEYIKSAGHTPSADAPGCTESVVCLVCFEVLAESTGHSYGVSESHEASCLKGAYEIHVCSGCGDSYEKLLGQPLGHSVTDWGSYVEIADAASACVKYHKYTASCSVCFETVEKTEGPFDAHSLTASIAEGDAATCQKNGYKTYSCSSCSYSYREEYADKDAHTWLKNEGASTSSVTVYDCACGETKRVINANTENANEATVDSTTLGEIGAVELENATIELDSASTDALSGNVSISASTADPSTIGGLSSELIEKIGENDIYSFGLTQDGAPVHDFGGTVTVRIPYVLTDDVDPECIAIWYIDDEGNVSTYKAVYSNGYAVFETTHFSYYTVTNLPAEERCALYGHSWVDTDYKVTCVSDGYTLHVCQRCGDSYRDNEVAALGHTFNETVTDPDCTHDGSTLYVCICGYSYTVRIPATGHDWQECGSREATCRVSGYTEYQCNDCSSVYRVTSPQLSHTYTYATTDPDCVRGGFVTATCSDCGHSYITERIPAYGHSYSETKLEATCTEDGGILHTCLTCGDSYMTDIVFASHEWDIEKPTCGKGQTCLACGAAGKPATEMHQWDIEKPTCDKGQTCLECGMPGKPATGKHSWNIFLPTCQQGQYCLACGAEGAPATGAHLWDIEAPLCNRGQICLTCGTAGEPATEKHDMVDGVCTVCGAGSCAHNYLPTIKEPTCTEGGYTVFACDLCGHSYQAEQTPAVGHSFVDDVCTVCGTERGAYGFYLEFVKSLLESDEFAIRIDDMWGDLTLHNMRLSFAELILTLDDDGNLIGYGTGEIKRTADDQTALKCDIALVDGVFYVYAFQRGYADMYAKMDLAYMLGGLTTFTEMLKLVKCDIVPFINSILDLNADLFGEAVGKLLETVLVKTTDADGTVKLSVDPEKLAAFIERLKSETIGELIGETGRLALENLPAMTVGELIKRAESYGITVEALLPILDKVAVIITGGGCLTFESFMAIMMEDETFDLEAFLADESLLSMTVFSALGGMRGMSEKDMNELFKMYVDPSLEMTVLELFANIVSENGASDAAMDVLYRMVDGLAETLYLEIRTDATGNLLSGGFSFDITDVVGTVGSFVPCADTDIDYKTLLDRITGYTELPYFYASNVISADGSSVIEVERDESGKIIAITVTTIHESGDNGGGDHKPEYGGENKPAITRPASTTEVPTVPSYPETSDKVELDENGKPIKKNGKEERPVETGKEEYVEPDDPNWNPDGESGKDPDKETEEEKDQYYTVYHTRSIQVRRYVFTEGANLTVSPDCSGYLRVEIYADYSSTYSYSMIKRTYTQDGTLVEETVEDSFMNGMGEGMTYATLYYSAEKDALLYNNDYSTLHEYELDEEKSIPAVGCEGEGLLYYVCTVCSDVRERPYTNGHDSDVKIEFLPGSTSCEQGIKIVSTCRNCGKVSDESTSFDHDWMKLDFSTKELGGCDHHVSYAGCLCGREYGHADVSLMEDKYKVSTQYIDAYGKISSEKTADTVGTVTTYSCTECDLYYTITSVRYGNSCVGSETVSFSYYYGSEQILPTCTSTKEYNNHDMRGRYELLPGNTSCLQGLQYSISCSRCGATEDKSYVVYDHFNTCVASIEFSDFGLPQGRLDYYRCPCGEQGDYWNINDCAHDWIDDLSPATNVWINLYDIDGRIVAVKNETVLNGCVATSYLTVLFDYDRKTGSYSEASETIVRSSYDSHDYQTFVSLMEGAKTCDEGVHYYSACVRCGLRDDWEDTCYYHMQGVNPMHVYDLSEYGIGGVLMLYECACEEKYSYWGCNGTPGFESYWDYVDGIEVQGERFWLSDGSEYIIARLRTVERNGCTVTETVEICFGFGSDREIRYFVSSRTYASHEGDIYEKVHTKKLGASCEKGVIVETCCRTCGEIMDTRTEYSHVVGVTDVIDLTYYGAREGELYLLGCACGEQLHGDGYEIPGQYSHTVNYIEATSYRTYDVYEIVFDADGFCIRLESGVLGGWGCYLYTYNVLYIDYKQDGTSDTSFWRPRHVETNHDFEDSCALKEGASDCTEGVTVTRTCKECGHVESYDTRDHEMFTDETIHLSDYGAVCPGSMILLRSCACDYRENYTFAWGCNGSTESIIIGDHAATLYTCAVTKPACGFRVAIQFIRSEVTSCLDEITIKIFIGCDANGNHARRTVTLTNHEISHDDVRYTETLYDTLVPCVKKVVWADRCADCGKIFSTSYTYEFRHELVDDGQGKTYCTNDGCERYMHYHYDDEGNQIAYDGIQYEFYGDPMIEGAYSYVKYTDEKQYTTIGGYSLESYSYRKCEYLVGNDGWVDWSSVTHVYHCETPGKCYRESFHESKYYEPYTTTESMCGYYQYGHDITVSEATCSQPGIAKHTNTCAFCEFVFESYEYDVEPLDHDWCYSEAGYYYCNRCELEHPYGASGSIIVEEMTSQDPDEILIGYYNRDGISFMVSVAAILKDPKEGELEEIYLSDFNGYIEQSETTVSFSRVAFEEVAMQEYGISADSYDIRVTFISYENNFDFSITLTK